MTEPDDQDQGLSADLIALEHTLEALNRAVRAVNDALDQLVSRTIGPQYAEGLTVHGVRAVGQGLAAVAGTLATLSAHMVRLADDLDNA